MSQVVLLIDYSFLRIKRIKTLIVRVTYLCRHNVLRLSCDVAGGADGLCSDERLLDEVLASRLPYSDTRYCSVVAFIGCGLLLGCNSALQWMYYEAYIRTMFMCALHYTLPLRCSRVLW